jgi:hypothetical protein
VNLVSSQQKTIDRRLFSTNYQLSATAFCQLILPVTPSRSVAELIKTISKPQQNEFNYLFCWESLLVSIRFAVVARIN